MRPPDEVVACITLPLPNTRKIEPSSSKHTNHCLCNCITPHRRPITLSGLSRRKGMGFIDCFPIILP